MRSAETVSELDEPATVEAGPLAVLNAPDLHECSDLRARFLADPGTTDLSELRPVVAGSWQRSLAWSADVELGPTPRKAELDHRVVDSAESAIRTLLRETREHQGCVVVADRFGTIAAVRGCRSALKWAEQSYVGPGMSLAEDVAGTNCIGTAIEEQRGVTVACAEHLSPQLDGCWSSSSLVRDPLRRSVRAVLGLVIPLAAIESVCPDRLTALVGRAAAEVVDVLAAKLAAREQALLTAYLRQLRKRGAGAVMAIDGRTTIANDGALELVGAAEQLVLAAYAQEAQRAGCVVQRELTRDDGSTIEVHVDPVVWGSEPVGSVLSFRPLSAPETTRCVGTPQRIDRFEALVGESPVFTRALELAHQATERGADAHIVGEAGTGKRSLALAMSEAACDAALSFDGRKTLNGAELAQVGPALERGRAVVVTRADLVPDAFWNELAALAQARRGGRFLLTGHSLPPAAMAFVRSIGSLEIEMPALRARRDDVPSLVSSFAASAVAGPRRASSRLIKALTEAELPGNVAQLREIVATAATRCSTTEMTTEDLTVEHRQTLMRTTLSPLQTAEAMQIREALREARGNRVRAAEILRIGRSTLYRRLDMYTRLGFEL